MDPANWFGVRKHYPTWDYVKVGTGAPWAPPGGILGAKHALLSLQNHLQVLLLLVFEAVVYRRQQYYRKQQQLLAPATETIFEDISREHLDLGLVSCAKYFINYFYYKFGLEVGAWALWGGAARSRRAGAEPCAPLHPQICFLMIVNVIGQRMNFLVILHGCWLVVMLTRRRRAAIARLWPKYCLFLVIFFLYQYLLCLGMPPALCIGKGHAQPFCGAGKGQGERPGTDCAPCPPRLSVALEQHHSRQLGARQVALPARLLPASQIHQPHQ